MQLRARARPVALVASGALAAMAWGDPAVSAADPWTRYENRHFVAYSNAPGKKVLPLLGDLENFRAAFVQVGNITVPDGGPKTTVLIPAEKKEFQKLASSRLQAGFATYDGKSTLIVMPAQGGKDWTRTVIRHEYGHALLRYKRFGYPAWYEEGFAELVSSTEIVKDGQAFTIGSPPQRAEQNGPPVFGWDVLVSDEFKPHELTNLRLGSSAYAQAWLLAHYATLGNDLKNAPRLQAYFDRLKEGEASTPAFEAAFGVKIDDLWETTLKPYARRMPYYTFPFRPGAVDPVFATSVPGPGEVEGLIRYLELRTAITGTPAPPKDVLSSVTGRWAPLRMGLSCEDYADFELTTATATVRITPSAATGSSAFEPEAYRYALAADGSLRLTLEADDGGGQDELHIRHRTPDLLCMSTGPEPGPGCNVIMYRCGG
jgi:hypothetical protein